METSRHLECLRRDAARLRQAAEDNLDPRVPSCPEWTVTELVTHVAYVYLHKVQCITLGRPPRPWPPEGLSGVAPLELMDRTLPDLLAEFDAHQPDDEAWTWYGPDQTVGFWIRRMAQETVIHRVDAELAVGEVTPIPADLAVDGIDEVLQIFLGWDSYDTVKREGPDAWPGLADATGDPVQVRAGGQAWTVRPTPAGVEVHTGETGEAATTISGDPADVLLWLWRRGDDDQLTVDGDPSHADRLRQLMYAATQ